jgi:hypothetical protein
LPAPATRFASRASFQLPEGAFADTFRKPAAKSSFVMGGLPGVRKMTSSARKGQQALGVAFRSQPSPLVHHASDLLLVRHTDESWRP